MAPPFGGTRDRLRSRDRLRRHPQEGSLIAGAGSTTFGFRHVLERASRQLKLPQKRFRRGTLSR